MQQGSGVFDDEQVSQIVQKLPLRKGAPAVKKDKDGLWEGATAEVWRMAVRPTSKVARLIALLWTAFAAAVPITSRYKGEKLFLLGNPRGRGSTRRRIGGMWFC